MKGQTHSRIWPDMARLSILPSDIFGILNRTLLQSPSKVPVMVGCVLWDQDLVFGFASKWHVDREYVSEKLGFAQPRPVGP
eukprot:965985-Pyramimonas_sp.AAC.1